MCLHIFIQVIVNKIASNFLYHKLSSKNYYDYKIHKNILSEKSLKEKMKAI